MDRHLASNVCCRKENSFQDRHCIGHDASANNSNSTKSDIAQKLKQGNIFWKIPMKILVVYSVNAQSAMDECFKAVHRWFSLNGLSLNPDKSEAIVVGTGARRRQEGAIGSVSLGGVNIPVSECVRSLGVTLDSTMSFDRHVDNVCKTAFHHVRALRRIRKLKS